MTTVKIFSQYEMDELVNENIFEGFYYFSNSTTRNRSIHLLDGQRNPIYFVAYKNNKIVGVLKLSNEIKFKFTSGVYELNAQVNYNVISFIDVHKDFKRQGVAKSLYEALSVWTTTSKESIVGTLMSQEGEKANLHKLRKQILSSSNNFDDESEFYSHLLQYCNVSA